MMCAVPTDFTEIIIFGLNSILMAPMVYIIFNTSSRFVIHRRIPRRWELLVCSFAFYWGTLGKIIYSVIRPSTSSVISYMVPQNPNEPKEPKEPQKSTDSFMWTFHEKMRKAFDSRIHKSAVGEHTGDAYAPSGIQSQNLQAAADRVVRDCGRVVCQTVQVLHHQEWCTRYAHGDHQPVSAEARVFDASCPVPPLEVALLFLSEAENNCIMPQEAMGHAI